MEPTDDLGLVFGTGQHRDSTVFDRNERLVWRTRCETATRTANTTSRPMLKKFNRRLRRVPTNASELLLVVVTANQWRCKLIEQQK
ncbi:hypothetical protein [Halobacterium sp. KA-6]|uniref:hypothetical protein n=1 Tax=Halobacterium sp. KA-6 TaxID=2896368 RepID=UPI001E63D044|nr:hypothetical protein [Halobacterium sp. KA-6]MCD2205185.1 hypothetical protein [Halobacterium sp. KA-6]